MRVSTNNEIRTIYEMEDMFNWLSRTFGPTGFEEQRWTYGKEPDWLGSTFCNGPFDIEWVEFKNDSDATVFKLRWA